MILCSKCCCCVLCIFYFSLLIFFRSGTGTHTNITQKMAIHFCCDSLFCMNDILLSFLSFLLSSSSSSSSQKQQREATTTTNNSLPSSSSSHQLIIIIINAAQTQKSQKSQKSDFGHFFTKHSDFNDDVHHTSIKRRRGRTRSKCIS